VKAFVTGGTGFLGRHLIDTLLAHGDDVTALVRTFDRARTLPPAVHTLAGDLTRPAALRTALRSADVLYHLGALHRLDLPPKDYPRLERINVEGTRALLTLAGDLGVPRLIYTSTLAIYGDTGPQPITESRLALPAHPPRSSAYAQSKYRAHVGVALPLQQQGLPLTLVIPGPLYGPGAHGPLGRLLRRYSLGRLPVAWGGDTVQSFTYAADAAEGHWLAATAGAPGATYLLPGPAVTLRAFLAEGAQATGLSAPRLWLPGGLARLLASLLRPFSPALADDLRAFSGGPSVASPALAQRALGWTARPPAVGLPNTVAWFQAAERRAEAERQSAAAADSAARDRM
jgi:nucleoside-diphosphate-sugar epimerase